MPDIVPWRMVAAVSYCRSTLAHGQYESGICLAAVSGGAGVQRFTRRVLFATSSNGRCYHSGRITPASSGRGSDDPTGA